MGLPERIAQVHAVRADRAGGVSEARFSWNDYVGLFSDPFASPLGGYQTLVGPEERVDVNFVGLVQGVYKRSGVVAACLLTRLLVLSEARFQWRRFTRGRPGDLFGTPDLDLLETPWPGGTTGDLIARMEQDAALAGNFFATVRGSGRRRRVVRMRPDWVVTVHGSLDDPSLEPWDLDTELIGYMYSPPSGRVEMLLPEQVTHFGPIPDPIGLRRGMSLLMSVIRDIEGDLAATTHKLRFFQNGATPNLVVTMDPSVTPENVKRFKTIMEAGHAGATNAYKTLYLGGGADIKPVGNSFEQMSYKAVQALGETRVAAALGVPPVLVGLSEGLASATYSNYGQARRRFGDGTARPWWRNAAGSLATLLPALPDARLWYDDRDVAFLREDRKDAAEIFSIEASTIANLVREGFTASSAKAAVAAQDPSLLEHTGLLSVQLQPPSTTVPPPAGQPGDDLDDTDDTDDADPDDGDGQDDDAADDAEGAQPREHSRET